MVAVARARAPAEGSLDNRAPSRCRAAASPVFPPISPTFLARYVGAIHERPATAWSTAGVVDCIRDAKIAAGVERARVYDRTLYILASFVVAGFICNALIGPVKSKGLQHGLEASGKRRGARVDTSDHSFGIGGGGLPGPSGALAWLAVGLPILWGAWQTLQSAVKIFS